MKFSLIHLIVVSSILLFLSACNVNSTASSTNDLTEAKEQDIPESWDGLTMKLEKDSFPISEKEIKTTFENTSEKEYLYGGGFTVEKKINGKWHYMKFKEESGVTDEGHLLPPGESSIENYSLDDIETDFEPGEYRIITRFGSKKLAAEFEYVSQ